MIPEGLETAATPSLLVPPVAVLQESNWPLLEMPRSQFDKLMDEMKEGKEEDLPSESYDSVSSEEDSESVKQKEIEISDDSMSDAMDPWSDDLELDDDSVDETPTDAITASSSLNSRWCESSLAIDHMAAGDVDGALTLLHRQIALVKPSSLLPSLRRTFLSVQSVTAGFPGMPALETPVQREGGLPFCVWRVGVVREEVKRGLKGFQSAHFGACEEAFQHVLRMLPLVQVSEKSEELEVMQFIDLAREYCTAVKLEKARQQEKGNTTRVLVLMALMTRCKLQTAHLLLPLHSAMVAAFKAENFIDAAEYARRILQNTEIKSPRNASLEQKAKKVLVRSEREGRNAVPTGLDDKPYGVECAQLLPLYREDDKIECPYCHASYRKDQMKQLCSICGLSQVGVETVGIVCMNSQ